MKIHPVGAGLYHVGEHDEADSLFPQFWNAPKNEHKHEKKKKISPYRAVNTLSLGYKNQPVNAVQGYNRCVYSDPHNTNK
jgi:hypothetical protein